MNGQSRPRVRCCLVWILLIQLFAFSGLSISPNCVIRLAAPWETSSEEIENSTVKTEPFRRIRREIYLPDANAIRTWANNGHHLLTGLLSETNNREPFVPGAARQRINSGLRMQC